MGKFESPGKENVKPKRKIIIIFIFLLFVNDQNQNK